MIAIFRKKVEDYKPTVGAEVNVKRKRPVLEEGWGIEFTLHTGELDNYPIKVDHVEGGKVWFKDLRIVIQHTMSFIDAHLTHYGQRVGRIPTNNFPVTVRSGDTYNMHSIRFEWVL